MQIGYIKLEKDEYLRWHMDNVHWVNKTEDPSNIIITPKKLSMVLQLSGEDEYEGGEFKVVSDGGEYTAKKKKGIFNIFPGYLVHRVTPVTSGIRRVLQVWCVGPNFK
jgi:predicted 2-oxoglutarate/Fe(II)-dependent dioxygenase YbiX